MLVGIASRAHVMLGGKASDRVELTGLRPLALPHHRTCGFPHPVVESSGLCPRKLPRQGEPETIEGVRFQCLIDHHVRGHRPRSSAATRHIQPSPSHA